MPLCLCHDIIQLLDLDLVRHLKQCIKQELGQIVSPFKMHKIIYFFQKRKYYLKTYVCLPYLKLSDPLSKTHLFFLFGLIRPCLTVCMLGHLLCFCCRLLTFFKINVFKKIFQEHYQSIKWFGSRSGPTFCQS